MSTLAFAERGFDKGKNGATAHAAADDINARREIDGGVPSDAAFIWVPT